MSTSATADKETTGARTGADPAAALVERQPSDGAAAASASTAFPTVRRRLRLTKRNRHSAASAASTVIQMAAISTISTQGLSLPPGPAGDAPGRGLMAGRAAGGGEGENLGHSAEVAEGGRGSGAKDVRFCCCMGGSSAKSGHALGTGRKEGSACSQQCKVFHRSHSGHTRRGGIA